MINTKVQEKLCTELTEPVQALEFAIALEEGVKSQESVWFTNARIVKA